MVALSEEAKTAHANEVDFHRQANQAAIDSGAAAIKTFFLLNGGASLAMLAFISAVAGPGRITDGDLQSVAASLMWFTKGVAFAAASGGAAYLTNYCTAGLSSSRKRLRDWPYLEKPTKFWSAARLFFLLLAIACGLVSLGMFVSGMYEVRDAVAKLHTVAPK